MLHEKEKPIQCVDGLLTIGGSYRWFSCGSKTTCAVPFRPLSDDHCFVHEAEWRGISRKVSSVPRWFIPGRARIFLAYGGSEGAKQSIRIYGYFVLHRVEVLLPFPKVTAFFEEKIDESAAESHISRLDVLLCDADTGKRLQEATVFVSRTKTDNTKTGITKASPFKRGGFRLELPLGSSSISVSASGYQPLSISCNCLACGRHYSHILFLNPVEPTKPKETERRKECPDGSVIITHRYIDGMWVRTKEKCDDGEPEDCLDGDLNLDLCENGSSIVTDVCVDGKWEPTGAQCPKPMWIDDETFVPPRPCPGSKRLQPRGVYIVDALGAEIADAFSTALKDTDIKSFYECATSDSQRQEAISRGEVLFEKIVEHVHGQRTQIAKVPHILRGEAYTRGELVLFKHPPLLNIKPRPVFRSATYIDGDYLLEQIADGKTSVRIRYLTPSLKHLRPSKHPRSITKTELGARLAENQNLNRAVATRFIDQLYQLAREELAQGRPFRLPHLGTFHYKGNKLEFTISQRVSNIKKIDGEEHDGN